MEAQKAEAVLPEAEFQVNMEEKLRLQKDLIRLMREESGAIATRNVQLQERINIQIDAVISELKKEEDNIKQAKKDAIMRRR